MPVKLAVGAQCGNSFVPQNFSWATPVDAEGFEFTGAGHGQRARAMVASALHEPRAEPESVRGAVTVVDVRVAVLAAVCLEVFDSDPPPGLFVRRAAGELWAEIDA